MTTNTEQAVERLTKLCEKSDRSMGVNPAARQIRADIGLLLALLPGKADREGWVLVPREPTAGMIGEGFEAIRMEDKWPDLMDRVYRAMIAAAPPAPSEGEAS